jgi:DNA-binding MarR family transcriptional regulator
MVKLSKNPLATQSTDSLEPRSPQQTQVRGIGTWLAIVSTYQTCSETLTLGIKPLGLKLAQHDVLMNLLMGSSLTQQQLAQRSFVTKSHMSAVLMEMQELGWIDRTGSEEDKRSKVITLTAQGRQLAQSAWQIQAQVVHGMMNPLSDQHLQDLLNFSMQAQTALIELQKSFHEKESSVDGNVE